MTTQPWHAALSRYGDQLFRLALLLTDDPSAAERATTHAFVQALATPTNDTESALQAALFKHPRQRWSLPQFRRRHALPRALLHVPPADRLLLGLWLLRDITGTQLCTITQQPPELLATRMTAALVRLLDADDPVRSDPVLRADFRAWVMHLIGLSAAPPLPPNDELRLQQAAWRARIDELRLTLRTALNPQHLPVAVVENIEMEMDAQQDDAPTPWQQRPAVIAAAIVAGAALLLALLIVPWPRAAAPTTDAINAATPAASSAQAIVQQALDVWNTQPVTGTLRRTVWALEPLRITPSGSLNLNARRDAHITDVWQSAESAKYRLEARRDKQLIEWQIGNGQDRLDYGSEPLRAACSWIDTGSYNRIGRSFTTSADEQRAVLQARLMQGAYGEGYLALQQALAAPDLRSFGTRVEGTARLQALSFTDKRTSPERTLLLWFDATTQELRAVQELVSDATTGRARDLWRVQKREVLGTSISLTPPQWTSQPVERTRIFDVTCPALDPAHIVSLRTLINTEQWWLRQYAPRWLPPDVTRAALISYSNVDSDVPNQPGDVRAVFIGPQRWLRLAASNNGGSPPAGEQRGQWRIQFSESPFGISATLCRIETTADFCLQTIDLAARGWTKDELLTMIDSLAPVDQQTWSMFDKLFIDPAPLRPNVQAILLRSLAAIKPHTGTLYSVAERTTRVNPARPQWNDPYHVPLEALYPSQMTQQQWIVYSDTTSLDYSDLRMLPDGTLLQADITRQQTVTSYDIATGRATVLRNQDRGYWNDPPPPIAVEMLGTLLQTSQPITLTEQPESWLLEQATNPAFTNQVYIGAPPPLPFVSDLGPDFVRRVWIDRSTALPQRSELVNRDATGREVIVSSTRLITWRYQNDPPPATAFNLPPLPADIAVIEQGGSTAPWLITGSITLQPMPRALMWPTSDTRAVAADVNPAMPDPNNQAARDQWLYQALSNGFYELDALQGVKKTSYRFSNDTLLVVRQGPRDLLRYLLRYNSRGFWGESLTWQASTPIAVIIAGQARTAWLLENNGSAMLVVEADELLLHISGPSAADLRERIAPMLADLEWVDLQAAPSNY